jgi:hypothetical protein
MISNRRFILVMLLAFSGLPCCAQVVGAAIDGIVTDSTGAGLPDVSVLIRNLETGTARKLVTDGGGRYSAPSIPVGKYQVTASKEGFQTQVRTGIELVSASAAAWI